MRELLSRPRYLKKETWSPMVSHCVPLCLSVRSVVCVLAILGIWVFSSGIAPGDVLTTTDNQIFRDLHVDSVIRTGNQVTFYLRGIRKNQVIGDPFPLSSDLVSRIEFRTPWDTGSRSEGRPAALVLQDSRRFEGVWIETCTRENNQLAFNIRQAGVPPGGDTHSVPLPYVLSIALTAMNLPGAELVEAPGLASVMPGDASLAEPPSVAAPTAAVLPSPAPAIEQPPEVVPPPAPAAPTPAAPPSLNPFEALPAEQATTAPPTPIPTPEPPVSTTDESKSGDDPWGTASKDDGFKFESDEYEFKRDRSIGPSWELNIFGYTVSLLSLLIGMLVAFTAGGISLYFSARTEDTSDLGFPKAVGTAALLTIFPPLLFYLCARYIPIFGGWAGIFVWYFSARAIIMGMLEILEAKAAAILIWFYVYLVLGQYLATKAIDKFF